MTTAHHLRLIDGIRAKEFPSERTASGAGASGPGYHTVYLHGEEALCDGDEAERVERRAQCRAEHDALIALLTLRWGEPQAVSLWSARERMLAGEETPQPWADAVARGAYLAMWRIEDRWIAVALHPDGEDPGSDMSVLVTMVDPP
ncbi:hypothetical protein OG291_29200 [Streptomyces halstedii]|uniref:hypothetical protein n=1 Tax=Streptomyces halstedii TaxID=1944 RepID=UPI003867D28E|nr:hypothetical protein OG291_29200 [Streptomyces halstedii]